MAMEVIIKINQAKKTNKQVKAFMIKDASWRVLGKVADTQLN